MAEKYHPDQVIKLFKFSIPIQIRFSDIDGYLHVNNGVYFNYMEHARALYLHQVCEWDFAQVGAVVANINLDFFKPINFFDQPLAYVRCISIGASSFKLEQVLMGNTKNGEPTIFSKAVITMVTVDMNSMKPIPLPDEYVTKMRHHDGLGV